MDYVAYIAQELGFSPEKSPHTNQLLSTLLIRNSVANHILNVACTVGDSGALGAILWGFESRELDLELVEVASGSRLHVNCGSTGGIASGLAATAVGIGHSGV